MFLLYLSSGFAVQAAEILKFEQQGAKERIIIDSNNIKNHKVFTINNPERLVVDIPYLPGKHTLLLPDSYKGNLIKSLRFAQFFNPKTSRFVFELNEGVKVLSIKENKNQKLVIEIEAKAPHAKSANNAQSKTDKATAKNSPSPKKLKADIPPLIVIDAGHGGNDPGTTGVNGTQEKDLVLWYAMALKAKLLKMNKYRILLTRHDDNFIMLRERVAIARRAGANLFISLHADSADDVARGLTVYTVSEKASDKEAEALAARENKSDVIGGMDLSGARPDVADILISLAQRETKNNSATLADFLVTNLDDRVRMVPNAHRFAGFAVLKAPDIPSVLIEIGFLSNAQEEKELRSKPYRDKVIDGITVGVESYFRRKSAMGMSN